MMNLALVVTIICGMLNSSPISVGPSAALKGEYVESRDTSVFAGPCHYNGEVVTTGGNAILAWHVLSGSWDGVDLSGVRAMAAVTCETNLADPSESHQCEIAIDSTATKAQSAAMVEMLKNRMGEKIGQIMSVRSVPIFFVHYARQYRASAMGFGSMDVCGMANDECCKQPNLVWYAPLMQLDWRKVGYSNNTAYTAGSLTDPWQRADENDAFYGAFTITSGQ
jgi:hypothetical protein